MQTYHNQGGIIQGRAQLVREYVGNLQDNTEALRSNFSGPSAPESPAIGQTYFNITENKEYTYTSNGWVPSDHNTSVYSEVVDARGQLANLNARLSVALNEDGTLKVPAELGVDEWKDPVYGISYVSKNSFTIPDDMTSVFTEGRAIKVVNGNTEVRTYVNSSEYNQQYNVTTVTTGNDVVTSNISAVRYSIIQNGLPHNVASMSSLIREPNTAYAKKVKVLLPSLNVSMCLQCTTAGTTSSGDLIVSKPSIGNTVTDGTVVWTIKEIGGVSTKDLESHNTAADAHADIRQAIENIDVSQDIQKHNTAADAHADIRQAIEDIDVSQDIQKHNTDSTAHADKFTQYLPLTGGNITGTLSLNDKFVAVSVNGQKADAKGNIDMSGLEGTQLYTSAGSYTWTVPDGISKVLVTASAGGGGGGYGCKTYREGYWEYGGYGGRGANCYKYKIAVTAGKKISIVIGNGGGPTSAGGATSFGDKLTLSGGGAGGNSRGEGHPGANAGAASPQSIFTSCPYSAYGAGGNRGGSGGDTNISPGAGTRGMMLLEWSWLS